MPGFRLRIDGEEIVAVSTDTLNVLSVGVRGDVVGPELASIDVSGGNYGGTSASTHLIWVDNREVTNQNHIEIEFLETISNSTPGRTVEELYCGSVGRERTLLDAPDLADQLRTIGGDLKQRPRSREAFWLHLARGNGEPLTFRSNPGDFSFSLTAMWRWTRPTTASLWLSTTTIDNIVRQQNGASLVSQDLSFNEKIGFSVNAA